MIDEAHVFLNVNTQRYANLENLKADKLIIMTASPIKESIGDLNIYNNIAINILQDNSVAINWSDKLKCVKNKPIISSTFDIDSPVTRYFKDTVVSINEKGLNKNKTKRAFSLVWKYNHISEKNNILLKEIRNILHNFKTKDSHFVIFTRFVDKEAYELGKFLEDNGFKKSTFSLLDSFSYYIVTGSNRQELGQFSRETHLPTILIVTYQIAEQGINLPGFNYVINYSISAYPSSLEQRFGRIDRMCRKDAQFEKITMCYLLNVCSWEINTRNFYTAVDIYIKSLIPYIPSKNVLLHKDVIKAYIKIRKTSEEYLNSLYNSLEELSNNKCTDNTLNEIKEICIDDEADDFNIQDAEKLKKVLNDKIREVKAMLKTEEPNYKEIEAFIKKLGNKVFYYYQNPVSIDTFENIISIDYMSTHEMAESIMGNESFQKYCEEFDNDTKLPILFSNYRKNLEEYFENLFMNNKIGFLDFLDNPCKYVPWNKFNEDFILIYNSNLQTELVSYIKKLPFFIMCKKYTEIIEEECNNISIEHCSHDPFKRTLYKLFKCDLEVSNKFKSKYCFSLDDLSKYFKIYYKDNSLEASEWLKLFYICMKASKNISIYKGVYPGNCYKFYGISLHGLYFTKMDNIR